MIFYLLMGNKQISQKDNGGNNMYKTPQQELSNNIAFEGLDLTVKFMCQGGTMGYGDDLYCIEINNVELDEAGKTEQKNRIISKLYEFGAIEKTPSEAKSFAETVIGGTWTLNGDMLSAPEA